MEYYLGTELSAAICQLKVLQGMHIVYYICEVKEVGYFASELVEDKCNQF